MMFGFYGLSRSKSWFGFGAKAGTIAFAVIVTTTADAQTKPLNDTGQTLCYDAPNAAVACSASVGGDAGVNPRQDARYGRDAQAVAGQLTKVGGGAAGFDFTKLCMNGQVAGVGSCPALPIANTGANPALAEWACTRDNVTGLVWSLQSIPILTWDNANSVATGSPVAIANASSRCNFSGGWRIPALRELQSIVRFSQTSGPSIDFAYFPGMLSTTYWANQLYGPNSAFAWAVSFNDGATLFANKSNAYSVIVVRSAQ